MRRFLIGASTLALAITLGTTSASAQFFVGAGATLPSGDYGDYAKTGWLVNAGVEAWRSASGKLAIFAEGLFGSNSHDDVDGDKTNIYGGLGSVTYGLGSQDASMSPYLIGSAGYLVHQYKSTEFAEFEGSDGGVAFGGGAGLFFDPAFVEARYMTFSVDGESTAFIFVGAGFTF
jgi:hypothetical protein